MIDLVSVPCNGCTACCQGDMIIIHPECGDDASLYETEPCIDPITGRHTVMLKHKRDGTCIYLGKAGCTIHDHSPAVCREFDCRRFYRDFYMTMPRAERRRLVNVDKKISKAVIEAGKSRLHTLKPKEHAA